MARSIIAQILFGTNRNKQNLPGLHSLAPAKAPITELCTASVEHFPPIMQFAYRSPTSPTTNTQQVITVPDGGVVTVLGCRHQEGCF